MGVYFGEEFFQASGDIRREMNLRWVQVYQFVMRPYVFGLKFRIHHDSIFSCMSDVITSIQIPPKSQLY